MMKKSLLMAGVFLCTFAQSMHAYKYRVANLCSYPIYVDLRGAAKGTLFEGNKNAKDSWRIKGYDKIPAKSTKNYTFAGLYCIDAIRVGKTPQAMNPMPIQKAPADVKAFNDTVEKITVVSNTVKGAAHNCTKLI